MSRRFMVLDNEMPADTSPQGAGSRMKKNIGWDNCVFPNKLLAYEYAYKWLGDKYKPPYTVEGACNHDLFNAPYLYSGHGDTIRVKEIL
jgi:hypothetical protein